MGTTYRKLMEICAAHKLSPADYSACMILNNWHNQGNDLEQALEKTQKRNQEEQRPLMLGSDRYGFDEACIKLNWEVDYCKKMLDFYEYTVLPESKKRSNPVSVVRRWLYSWKIYGPKGLDDLFDLFP